MTPVVKPLQYSLLEDALLIVSSSSLNSRALLPCALPRLEGPQKPRPQPPRPSRRRFSCNGRSGDAICASSKSRFWSTCVMRMKIIVMTGQGKENYKFAVRKIDTACEDGSTFWCEKQFAPKPVQNYSYFELFDTVCCSLTTQRTFMVGPDYTVYIEPHFMICCYFDEVLPIVFGKCRETHMD